VPFNFQRLENVRIALALVAAVVTGGAALYGVYVNAREATAASYETLAPEINQLKQAVARLEEQNQELRQRLAARPADASPERPAPPAEGRTPARRPRSAGKPAPSPSTSPPVPTTPPEARPGEPAPTPPEPAPAPPPPSGSGSPRDKVLENIEKRVPIDFEKAREVWKNVKGMKK
jgi:hypothetical protein